jgi:hypothetical protein
MVVDLSGKNLSYLDIKMIPKLESAFILDISNNEIDFLPDLRNFKIKELIIKNNPIADDEFVFLKINATNVSIGTKVVVSSVSLI